MKNKLFVIFLLLTLSLQAQQVSHMSQWMHHQYAINPAYTGIKTCLEAQSTIRGQWIKVDGAPYSGWVSVNAPLKAKRTKFLSARHGLGGMVYLDQIGPFQDIRVQLSYAGHFNFSLTNRLSLGLAVGARQLSFDLNKAKPLTPDPTINGSASQILPTATFGAWWNGKNYFVGFSLYELIPQKWNVIGTSAQSQMHAMLTAGYKYQINPKIDLYPGMYFAYTKNTPIELQVHGIVEFQRKFNFGLGLRNTDALIAMVGFRFKEKWKLGYSYDFILSKMRPNTFHSHELTLSFSPCKQRSESTSGCADFD
ncbi:hypothetical protein D3C71_634630 [compost metagenome]